MRISMAYTLPTNIFPYAGNTEKKMFPVNPFVSAILNYQEKFNLPKELVTTAHSPEDPETQTDTLGTTWGLTYLPSGH